MISLVMLAIMAGCAVGLYLKGTLAQGVVMIFNALVAGLVAFGFFEMASTYLIKYAAGITPWAPMTCFLLLLVLVFAILMAVEMTIEMRISKEKINFGVMPERIGRPAAGVVLGYVLTGYLLIAAAMAPLPSQYPYPRFDSRSPNPNSPKKALLSPDGFVTGLFATVSKGSFSPIREPKSFAMLHAGYVDQLYLNRHKGKDVPLLTSTLAIDSPRKSGVWNAPQGLRDADGKAPSVPAGTSLMLVRMDIKRGALKDAAKFTLSQVRLVCGPKGVPGQALAGKGQAIYPLGYIGSGGRLELKSLAEVITIDPAKVQTDVVTMDLGFAVPASLVPVLLEFKRNNVVQVSTVASPDDAPQPIAFGSPAPAPQPETPGQPAVGADPNAPAAAQPTAPPSGSKSRSGGKGGKKKRGLSDVTKGVTGVQVPEN